jgi:hypothetical protein
MIDFFAFKPKKLEYKLSVCVLSKGGGEMACSISYSNTTSHPPKNPNNLISPIFITLTTINKRKKTWCATLWTF